MPGKISLLALSLSFSLSMPMCVSAQQHPALQDTTPQLDAKLMEMRARVNAVMHRPDDLSEEKVAYFRQTLALAESGNAEAQQELAQLYGQGAGTPRNQDQALAWLTRSAENGHGPAQAFLGAAYVLGNGVKQDRKLGEYWTRKGAAQDVELAHYMLAMHFESIDSSAKEQAHALHWLKFYADNGFIPVYNEIGYRLMKTAADEAQRQEAFGWYMKAAKTLDPSGLNNVAYSYEVGQGVAQSDEAALGWYELAAIAKSPPGQAGLARLLEQGRGGATRQGPKPAPYELYVLAARQGDSEAIERLIEVFERGELGQKADAAQAAWWRSKLLQKTQ